MGIVQVPVTNPELRTWVLSQRQNHKHGRLTEEKVNLLSALGFIWNGRAETDKAWEENFRRLAEFRKNNGHCNVPQGDPFGAWLHKQRQDYKKGRLSQAKIDRLNALDISWDPHNNTWEENFQQLLEFHKENGHCNVSGSCRNIQNLAAGSGDYGPGKPTYPRRK